MDKYNCQSSDEVQVTVYPLPKINLGDDINVEINQQVILDANPTNNIGIVLYRWSDESVESTLTVTEAGI